MKRSLNALFIGSLIFLTIGTYFPLQAGPNRNITKKESLKNARQFKRMMKITEKLEKKQTKREQRIKEGKKELSIFSLISGILGISTGTMGALAIWYDKPYRILATWLQVPIFLGVIFNVLAIATSIYGLKNDKENRKRYWAALILSGISSLAMIIAVFL